MVKFGQFSLKNNDKLRQQYEDPITVKEDDDEEEEVNAQNAAD